MALPSFKELALYFVDKYNVELFPPKDICQQVGSDPYISNVLTKLLEDNHSNLVNSTDPPETQVEKIKKIRDDLLSTLCNMITNHHRLESPDSLVFMSNLNHLDAQTLKQLKRNWLLFVK